MQFATKYRGAATYLLENVKDKVAQLIYDIYANLSIKLSIKF